MNKKYNLLFAVIISALSPRLSAQDFKLPDNISLKYTADYAIYQPYVIKSADWLENTPLDQDKDMHSSVYGFLFTWVNGAPNVHVVVEDAFINLKIKKNFPLLIIYMAAWSKYELQHKDKPAPSEAALAAIRGMIKVYKKGVGVVKDKSIEKLIAIEEKGGLEKYVNDHLPKENE